jgi:hypothetical protein
MDQDGMTCTGMIWFRMGTSVVLLWTPQWTFVFHQMLAFSRVTEQVVASRGLVSMHHVTWHYNIWSNIVWVVSWEIRNVGQRYCSRLRRIRLPVRSFDYSVHLILPAALWPLASNRNEY